MKLLWAYVREHRGLVALTLLLATINQGFSLLDPQITRLLIDRYGVGASQYSRAEFIEGVAMLLLAFIGVALVSRIAKNFQDYYTNVITKRVGTKLYADSISHAFSLPFSVFEDERSGALLQKLLKARTDSEKLIQNLIALVFASSVAAAVVIGYAFYVHWSIGLAYALLVPVLGLTFFVLSRRIKQAQEAIVRESAALAGSTTETIRNVELVKSLGLEEQELSRLEAVNEKILGLELSKIKLMRMLGFVQGTLVNAIRAGIFFLLLWLIYQGEITLGQYFTLFIYSFYVFNPLAEFGQVVATYQEARGSMGEISHLLGMRPEPQPEEPREVGGLSAVSFEDVSFSYAGHDKEVLRGISFSAERGETVAFVGPSGSGKTTIIKLLTGLYKPAKGRVSLNGIPSEEIDYAAFRQKTGLVSQETQLFAGTIRDNLLFSRPGASDEECLAALSAAQASSIIERGGEGLDTRIGEGGIKISGGERQRLAIARALLREPELLIFDEATSSLDSITEKAITETIRSVDKKAAGITFLVAHRLSTILHADRIYVLEKGAIVEEGVHADLVAAGGLYAALWREQRAE